MAIALTTFSGAEELADQLDIVGIVQVKFAVLVVLKLWVVMGLLRDDGSTEEENTFNFEVWLISKHAHSCKRVLSEVFKSLDKTFNEILSLPEDFTLAFVFIVV